MSNANKSLNDILMGQENYEPNLTAEVKEGISFGHRLNFISYKLSSRYEQIIIIKPLLKK